MSQFQAPPIQVMLIDDHKSILWGLQKLIDSDHRFKVCCIAANPTDALSQIKLHLPDVILLDLDLGSDSGVELIPNLLSQSKAKVIVLTGVRETDIHDKAVVKGARGILTKDEEPQQLLKAIERVHEGELWLNRNATSRILMEIAKANAPKVATKEESLLASLTKKELNVYHAVISGSDKTLKEIASLLHTSEHTLRNHLASIYGKLGVSNRLELYVFSNHMPNKANS